MFYLSPNLLVFTNPILGQYKVGSKNVWQSECEYCILYAFIENLVTALKFI